MLFDTLNPQFEFYFIGTVQIEQGDNVIIELLTGNQWIQFKLNKKDIKSKSTGRYDSADRSRQLDEIIIKKGASVSMLSEIAADEIFLRLFGA